MLTKYSYPCGRCHKRHIINLESNRIRPGKAIYERYEMDGPYYIIDNKLKQLPASKQKPYIIIRFIREKISPVRNFTLAIFNHRNNTYYYQIIDREYIKNGIAQLLKEPLCPLYPQPTLEDIMECFRQNFR